MARKILLTWSCDLPPLTFLPWVKFSPLKAHYTSQSLLTPSSSTLPGIGRDEREGGGRKPHPNCLTFSHGIVSAEAVGVTFDKLF